MFRLFFNSCCRRSSRWNIIVITIIISSGLYWDFIRFSGFSRCNFIRSIISRYIIIIIFCHIWSSAYWDSACFCRCGSCFGFCIWCSHCIIIGRIYRSRTIYSVLITSCGYCISCFEILIVICSCYYRSRSCWWNYFFILSVISWRNYTLSWLFKSNIWSL